MQKISISKHLMLLFIGGEAYNKIHDSDFKTSYVIVYLAHISPLNLLETFQNILCYCLSGTAVSTVTKTAIFQNILCYCLSIQEAIDKSYNRVFQNILCYCLSVQSNNIVKISDGFQNILCYCLSLADMNNRLKTS